VSCLHSFRVSDLSRPAVVGGILHCFVVQVVGLAVFIVTVLRKNSYLTMTKEDQNML
jgi:hypothetical protein